MDDTSDAPAAAAAAETKKKRVPRAKKEDKVAGGDGRRFQRELRSMMFGFGDDREPLQESVHLMEELVVDYVYQVLLQATQACEQRQRGLRGGGAAAKVKERDLLFALRKDKRRQERVVELLEVWKEVKQARGSIEDLEKEG